MMFMLISGSSPPLSEIPRKKTSSTPKKAMGKQGTHKYKGPEATGRPCSPSSLWLNSTLFPPSLATLFSYASWKVSTDLLAVASVPRSLLIQAAVLFPRLLSPPSTAIAY